MMAFPSNLMQSEPNSEGERPFEDLRVSFGLSCSVTPKSGTVLRSSSFSGISGAGLSANPTLANTNVCNGRLTDEILSEMDSPNSFKPLQPSTSFPSLDHLTSSPLSSSPSENNSSHNGRAISPENSCNGDALVDPTTFLNALDVKLAGGAAGQDRVQAVCSEENGWLYCGVYDGFSGRDAADFLAGTLYENIASELNNNLLEASSSSSYREGVQRCLTSALARVERKFMEMVELEMNQRLDLVSIGSSVLAMLLHGTDLYIMNLGDSRAVLGTEMDSIRAVQLTEIHSVHNESEVQKLIQNHPHDPMPIVKGRVKGILQLTRAVGVGFLKKKEMNDKLFGIFKVKDLCEPPYIYTEPFVTCRTVSESDSFVVLGSDGLFDFFSNQEVVELVDQFIKSNPSGDPAKYMIEQLIPRAAKKACFSIEELMNVPLGDRRKFLDDVTVIVIILGNNLRTSKASSLK